jgi:hypothetical protein
MVHSQGNNKDTMYSEVSVDIVLDKKTVVGRNKEWYSSRETRGIPGPAASSSRLVRFSRPKKNMSSGSEVPQPSSFQQLSLLLETQPETFASGSREIQDAALRSTEHVFNIGALVASWRHRLETLTTFMQL